LLTILSILKEITVDVNHPECNREVEIIRFDNQQVDSVCYSGFEISVVVHLFDVLDEKVQAYLVGGGNKNKVLLKMPSVSRMFLEDTSTLCEHQYGAIAAARKMHRVEMLADDPPPRATKFLLLKFPFEIAATPFF
jgi:hypothetical protein